MKLYVDVNAPVSGDGSEKRPFTTIQAAADVAQPGDCLLYTSDAADEVQLV